MKKIVALALAMMLVLAMGSTALAANGFSPVTAGSFTISDLEKTLEGVDGITFSEELTFTVAAAGEANPDSSMISVSSITVTGKTTTGMTINYPAYTLPGLYHYEITEVDGNTQGVTYDTNKILVSVLVGVEIDASTNAPKDSQLKILGFGITKPNGGEKDNKIENTFTPKNLTITKTVSGNMADLSQFFEITVAFTNPDGDTVRNDITVTDSNTTEQNDSQTILGTGTNAWTEKTVTLHIKNGETVTFTNIPDGVYYTVTEAAAHKAEDPTYTDGTKGYTVGNEVTTAVAVDGQTTNITNTKNLNADTGIALESVPYIMILAVAMMGAMVIISRKRREEM